MEQVVGIELCTGGTSEVVFANGRVGVHRGMLMIVSPAFPMFEMWRSDDWSSERVMEPISDLLPILSKYITAVANPDTVAPYRQLDDMQYRMFLGLVERMRQKERQIDEAASVVEREMSQKMLSLIRQELILEAACLFVCGQDIMPHPPSKLRTVVMDFLKALNGNYATNRSVAFYAGKAGLTQRHFSDIVKRHTDLSPKEWITMITINHAKNLLAQPGVQVKDVAYQLGFHEQFTFRKYFKKATGIPPSAYQSQVRKNR